MTHSGATQSGAPEPARPGRAEHRWYPALDGLRGVAVIAVVLFHADIIAGGWLGVDLFFVLSGFLITRLITVEHRESGRIALGAFWKRRARRLLPALVVFFPVVALLVVWAPERRTIPTTVGGEMLAAIAYVANWFTLVATGGYWDQFSQASPLRHLWSLAIEEQFYVVFPLVALAAFSIRRRHALLGVLGALTLLSWAWAMLLLATGASFERVYLGTDTRLAAITLGGAAGYASVSPRFQRAVTPAVRWLAWPALALVIGAMITVSGTSGSGAASWTATDWLIMVVFEVAVVVLLLHSVLDQNGPDQHTGARRLVSVPVLVWFGVISYGLYLWHIPVQFVLEQRWPGLDRWTAAGLMLGVGALVAWLSYRLIERPIRTRGLAGVFGGPSRQIIAVVTSVCVLTVGVIVTMRATADVRADELVTDLLPAAPTTEPGVVPDVIDEASPTAGPVPSTDEGGDGDIAAEPSAVEAVQLPIARPVDASPSMLLLGDSMVTLIQPQLVSEADRLGVAFSATSHIGCPVGGREVTPAGGLDTPEIVESCSRWLASLPSTAAQVDPDVIVIMRNAVRAPSPSTGPDVCRSPYREWHLRASAAEIDAIAAASDAPIVFTTHAYNRADPDDRAALDRETECANEMLLETAATTGVGVVDLGGWICPSADTCRVEQDGVTLRPDGLHFEDEGAELMLEWLLAQVFAEA